MTGYQAVCAEILSQMVHVCYEPNAMMFTNILDLNVNFNLRFKSKALP